MRTWAAVLTVLGGAMGVVLWRRMRLSSVPVDRGPQKERHGRINHTGPHQA